MQRGKTIGVFLAVALTTSAAPALASAVTPHWYVDGVKATEGKRYPSVSWGTLTITEETNITVGPINSFTCEDAAIGDYNNPTGGGPGEGETDMFVATDCVSAECPEEDGLELQVHSENLPWVGVLLGTETGADELETQKAFVVTGCYEAHTSTLVEPPETCSGNWDPEFRNGSQNLSQVVSRTVFTGQSDRLVCVSPLHDEVEVTGIMEKSLNTMDYGSPVPTKKVEPETANNSQNTLEVKNP